MAHNNSSGPSYRAIKSKVIFRSIFRQRRATQKGVQHYKPCPMTSLSSGKSWDIFDFFIFSYFKLRVYFWALIHKLGYIRSGSCHFFRILHSRINNPTLALFWFRPYFEKFFTKNPYYPYQKKCRKFFLNEIWQFIHQSIALVEFSRNMLLLNFFEVISGQKILKTMLKYVLKYHVLGLKSVKNECFWSF